MKGFIEVTNVRGTKHLVNVRHIEEVMNSTLYLDVVNPDCDEQDRISCEESYEEIKAKIAEAVGEMPAADVMSIEEAAELLGRVESIPCDVNGNEWLQEICEHKDACADTSGKDCWLQYLKYRKIKAIRPHIIVTGTVEKPYYEILYYDIDDGEWHIGYSSYSLINVMKWKEECFEIVGEIEDMVVKYAPTADVVSKEEFEQVKWERDTAIGQLESYGVGFCEDKELKEVKHGEWFLLDECANEGVYCSVCYKKVYKTDYANQKLKSKYCPNCGARMGATDTNVGSKTKNSFMIIDNETGKYPNCEKIALSEEWAKHLVYCDIDTFAITEAGNLILLDDCGNCAFCPADRFTVVFDKDGAENA